MRAAFVIVSLAALLLLAVAGPSFVPWPPMATSIAHRLEPPSWLHWLGTDALGRDVFSRIVTAARTDLLAAGCAVALSAIVGAPIGVACGYFGGRVDRWAGRIVDVLMAFPLFVAAMILVAVLGNSLGNVIAATAIINLPFYIRVTRAEIGSRRGAAYVVASRLGGAGEWTIVTRVLLPNILPTLVTQMSVNFAWAILNTAGLSFIGIGIRPPSPEWGVMVADGAQYLLSGQWWIALAPGFALFAAVYVFTLTGDTVRDWLDPRRSR